MLDYLETLLGTNTDLVQVIQMQDMINTFTDASPILVDTLEGLMGDRLWPIVVPEGNTTFPQGTYTWMKEAPGIYDGYPLIRNDTYVVGIQTKYSEGYDDFVTLAGAVSDALEAYQVSGGSQVIEKVQSASDYDEERDVYHQDIEVVVTQINAASKAIPMAGIGLQSVTAEAGDMVPLRQKVYTYFSVVLMAPSEDMETLRVSVQSTLLGASETDEHFGIEYVSGEKLDTIGHLMLWRETYVNPTLITEVTP